MIGNADTLDALDFEMPPGCVLSQLGGLAGQAAWYYGKYEHLRHKHWYYGKYEHLRHKHWPSVLAWNLSLGSLMDRARGAE